MFSLWAAAAFIRGFYRLKSLLYSRNEYRPGGVARGAAKSLGLDKLIQAVEHREAAASRLSSGYS